MADKLSKTHKQRITDLFYELGIGFHIASRDKRSTVCCMVEYDRVTGDEDAAARFNFDADGNFVDLHLKTMPPK